MKQDRISQSSEYTCREIIKELDGLGFSRKQRRVLIEKIGTLKLTKFMVSSILMQSIDEIETSTNYSDDEKIFIKEIISYLKGKQIGNYIRDNANINQELRSLVEKHVSQKDFFEPVEFYKSIQELIKEAFGVETYCYTKKRNGNLANVFDRDAEINNEFESTNFHNEITLNTTKRIFCSEQSSKGSLFAVKLNIPGKGDVIVGFGDEKDNYDNISRIGELLIDHKLLDLVQEKLKYLSARFIDKLTGAYNKDYIDLIGKKPNYSIITIDINDFKIINDYCGYTKGDEALKDLTKIISENIREKDRLCRQGGDEFVIFIEYDNSKTIEENRLNLEQIDKRIKSSVSMIKYSYITESGPVEESLTISTGIALFEKGKNYTELSKIAEGLMKKEKTNESAIHRIGKNIQLLGGEEEQIKFYINQLKNLSSSSKMKILKSLEEGSDKTTSLELNHSQNNSSVGQAGLN